MDKNWTYIIENGRYVLISPLGIKELALEIVEGQVTIDDIVSVFNDLSKTKSYASN